MFSNRFNTKNDPLIEAVKQAQADGDLRRQAVAIVNEAFGVFSRNAVIREELAEYDAAIEEVYGDLKESVQIDEVSDALKTRYLKKNVKDQEKNLKHYNKAVDKGDDNKADKMDRRIAKREYGFALASKKKMEEAKANDGNLANNYPPYDKVTRGDVVAGRLGKDQMGGKRKMNEEPVDYSGKSTVTQERDPKATSYDKTLPKEYPGAASSAPTGDAINRAKASVTPIKEAAYSAKSARAGKDIAKRGKMFDKIAKKAGERYGSEESGKRVAGKILQRIRAKHMKEDSSF